MEKKYYTPTIEEFHVGFEFESEDTHDDLVSKCFRKDEITIGTDIFTTNRWLENKEIRVKYLDREDIESLGWKNHVHSSLFYFDIPNVATHSGEYFLNDKLIGYPDYEMVFEESNKITIRDCERDVIFCGTIRNKSELKKLMQQLQIKQL